MNVTNTDYRFYPADKPSDDFFHEVVNGLGRFPRRIAPKYFYDERGAALFESICEQPEYYPTATEFAILREHSGAIAERTGTGQVLIEPGCGSCEKVRALLDDVRPVAYVPVDISCRQLQAAASEIAEEYAWLDVHAVCTDITDNLELPEISGHEARLVFYPGSSIGNFEPEDAVSFLGRLAETAGADGRLLIGVDLEKDHAILNAAYNDANGVTAEFNLNLLQRINRELDANFDINAFDHHAFYNSIAGRVEMHLISTRRQTVRLDGHTFEFSAGDSIHTENSYKYTNESFRALAADAGFIPVDCWTDADMLFGLHLLQVAVA
ncbi:MAG: L-histidine N(alpha)-methyltransferase [Gammaproteobacteria bacterium]